MSAATGSVPSGQSNMLVLACSQCAALTREPGHPFTCINISFVSSRMLKIRRIRQLSQYFFSLSSQIMKTDGRLYAELNGDMGDL